MAKNVYDEGHCTQYTNLHLLQGLWLVPVVFSELLRINIVLFLFSVFSVPGELGSTPKTHRQPLKTDTSIYRYSALA
jgi:hypothetical protein